MIGFVDYIKAGVVGLLAGMLLAGAGVWWAKDQQVKAAKIELQTARDANEANVATIAELGHEVERLNKSCSARVEVKDQTIKRLKEIDELGVTPNETDAVGDRDSDPVLRELNGMWKLPDRQD